LAERDPESGMDSYDEMAEAGGEPAGEPGDGSGSDRDLSGYSSASTDVSDDSGTPTRQYKWRKRLQAQKYLSLSRHQRASTGTAARLLETASSLPDLELYKTWDPRTTLKVSTRVHFT
jgi:hypothetical protein